MCIRELNQLLAENSDTEQGEPEQEQSRHGEAEHRARIAGDSGDGAGSHYEPHDSEMAAREGGERTCTGEDRRDDGCRWCWVAGHPDADGEEVGAGEKAHEAED